MKSKTRKTLLAAALVLFVLPTGHAFGQNPANAEMDEEFRYQWRLRNFVGAIAGMFLPKQGEGSLTFKTQKNGHLKSELLITSPKSRQGEYFRYGSEVDTQTLQPIRAWSSYSWRGEEKSKSENIIQRGVLDVAAGIYAIRQDPPEKPRRMEIWSDGKVYPVLVTPLRDEKRKIQGREELVRHYTIRGVQIPDRRKWKGKLDLWLAKDEAATPVEILISRNLADVHLQLQSAS
jgi:hypothetical protein